ncbi:MULTISPECIES: two-partner secretion domain-containing protein [unclassified Tolypothrix]|uniref:two-partner secretion domain-containing protein n=1 Tax=unclassified Tolypothrix TaxID=2649714 RepID=UPI0005EABA96|nr:MULTISPECIES: S-layer family protein [unclassified Tolypothrix]BAY89002.1 filamentous hemagglutinin family outer membrane protein [Microchaete diplosiphon NIES-3275]EKF06147.1 filamentous hemagglutinin [Tolypothrix sp. PCC 7601]MBE9080771.1 S-layer family protein [Tolypothrix sp. LEGE 11397]UYD29633.1 S-layer family protein [Tolypothrix sp. PCC 7712]UYD34451.1 S-layer family protein [Tolypothrix sp. PCC 7601]
MIIIYKESNFWFQLLLTALTTGFFTSGISSIALAQVTSDGTTNTIVNTNGNDFTILNGIDKGNNLFHSFSNLSVPTGGSATFDLTNTPNITTIFSRVTGGNISNIDGLIRTLSSNNPVSLFLMNPNGIVFGPNASLNIGGSFVGTTANSIKFADGAEFSAVPSADKPLLTMSVPVGLQMGQNSGGIAVEGLGHRITGDVFTPLDPSQNPTGLQVLAGNTLALIGNEVNFSGGIVATKGGGHLEVSSVQQGQVGLTPSLTRWVGDYSQVEKFNDIHLAQQSLLDASGSNGSIQIQGKNINLSTGSAVVLQNLGEKSQGITIRATESLSLTGNTSDQRLGSIIKIDNLGTGSPGDILIGANQLSLEDGGAIWNRAFTEGVSGNISINVEGLIDLNGFVLGNPAMPSSIATITTSSSNAGDILISTSNLRIRNGGGIASTTVGFGQSGRVGVNAKDLIEIFGINPISKLSSLITSSTFFIGNVNSTVVNTSRLIIRDGGFLGSSTLSQGAAGSVMINASDFIEVSGRAAESITSSRIASSSEILDLVFQLLYGLPAIPTGDAGALTINTPSLRVTDGALVTVKNDGPGKAGDLQINANAIFLDNQGSISASTASGNGGNIHLNLQNDLLMRHDSWISATSKGTGNGGNLSVNSPVIVGLENSDIIANAVKGQGGNIDITTQGIFGIKYRNQLTSESDITASSQFGVNGTVDINNFGVDPNSGLVELPANVTDSSQQIASGCSANTGSSFVATGRGGVPQNPTQEIRSDRTWSDTRDISAFQTTQPVKVQILKSPATLVQATGWRRNAMGKIELVANNSLSQVQPSLTCAAVPQI